MQQDVVYEWSNNLKSGLNFLDLHNNDFIQLISFALNYFAVSRRFKTYSALMQNHPLDMLYLSLRSR